MRRFVLLGLLLLSACGDPSRDPEPGAPQATLPTGTFIDLAVDAHGIVTIGTRTFDLEADREVALEGVLSALLATLERSAEDVDPDASTTVRLAAARDAAWRYVHWLRQVSEHAALAKYDLRFEAVRRDEVGGSTPAPHYPVADGWAPEAEPLVTMQLDENGVVTLEGQTYDLVADQAEAQEMAVAALTRALMELANRNPALREEGTTHLLVKGEREAKWQWVQWIMQIAAHPRIGIHKIKFAVWKRDDEGR